MQSAAQTTPQTARFLLRLLGVLNSVADIIPYGRLHMRPLQLFLIAQWSMASQLLCFLVKLNKVFFHHLRWWEDKHNLTCRVPLTSPKTSSTLCMDSSTTGCWGWGATLDAGDSSRGRGKHKICRDDGDLSGIEPLLLSPQRSDHPDSNRQLDLRIVPKMPRRHQGAPVDLPHLEVVPSLHGSQHPAGSGTSSRQVKLSGGSAQFSTLTFSEPSLINGGGARNRFVRDQTEQAAAHLCQPLSRPSGLRHRSPEHGLGHSSLSVPRPSISHPSGGVTEGQAV